MLKRAQPHRKAEDVFPTAFKLNSMRDIVRHFPPSQFESFTYRALPEPGYHFNLKPMLALMLMCDRLLPAVFTAPLFIFLRRK